MTWTFTVCMLFIFIKALINFGIDYTVGRIKVIFTIPQQVAAQLFHREYQPPKYLAYVEWFTSFSRTPHPDHLLYRIKAVTQQNHRVASIVSLDNVRRSAHLFPDFKQAAPAEWNSLNVLDLCDTFYLNSFSDRYMYHLVN